MIRDIASRAKQVTLRVSYWLSEQKRYWVKSKNSTEFSYSVEARKMRAKVTTILSSFYICIYQDVFKVLDVNSREAVKMDQNCRDVKGAFLSLGTIRQPASLASWGRTRQPAQGNHGEVRQKTETVCERGGRFEKLKTGQGGSQWWELNPEAQACGCIHSRTGCHIELCK